MTTPHVVVSTSGGKDSTACCLHLRELGIDFSAIFMDTGWESLETYRYLEALPAAIGTDIKHLRAEVPLVEGFEDETLAVERVLGISPSPFVRLCVKKGVFPARTLRWCTEMLKVEPAIAHFRALRASGRHVVNVVGIRHEESAARASLPEYEWSEPHGGVLVWRPLVEWTEDDVVAIHTRTGGGIKPNRLYLEGASRVGCWPCIFARKLELRRIVETDPGRIKAIEMLEALVARRWKERMLRKGPDAMKNKTPPTLFQAPSLREVRTEVNADGTERKVRSGACWPIAKVAHWSKTSWGGKNYEPFALAPSDAGCLRWGFCENNNVDRRKS